MDNYASSAAVLSKSLPASARKRRDVLFIQKSLIIESTLSDSWRLAGSQTARQSKVICHAGPGGSPSIFRLAGPVFAPLTGLSELFVTARFTDQIGCTLSGLFFLLSTTNGASSASHLFFLLNYSPLCGWMLVESFLTLVDSRGPPWRCAPQLPWANQKTVPAQWHKWFGVKHSVNVSTWWPKDWNYSLRLCNDSCQKASVITWRIRETFSCETSSTSCTPGTPPDY